ncbi:MAG TPA: enoyl-CoA hydratase-related protein [Gammaproteobacteria bacterium]|nr:enoyl-CoA hydratase-related protein [Gammaproteobacteria bacterium]
MHVNVKTLKLKIHSKHILLVALDRPNVRNAINSEMMEDFLTLWNTLIADAGELRCVILTGSEQAFCAGADLKERLDIRLETLRAQRAVFEQAMLAMLDCPIPVIAAVNGAAFGGGLELVLASDFAYASKTATFSQSEVKIGIIPAALGTQHLPRSCGLKRAKELAFTGDIFSATEAREWNIINKLCEPNLLIEETLKTAEKIAENAPLAIRSAKKSLNMSQQLDIQSGFAYEIEAYNQLLLTKDREEGLRAFNEKRKPLFKGT